MIWAPVGRLIGSWAICLYSFLDHQHPHQHPSSASSAFITHHCLSLLIIAWWCCWYCVKKVRALWPLRSRKGPPQRARQSFEAHEIFWGILFVHSLLALEAKWPELAAAAAAAAAGCWLLVENLPKFPRIFAECKNC